MISELLQKRVDIAIDRLRCFVPKDGKPYWGCFSGGKDSVVIKELARLAGVPVEWHLNLIQIDPPELIRFVREHHKDVSIDKPGRPFLFAVAEKGIMPTRMIRWCCEEFKEGRSPRGSRLIMGVRWEESPRRAKTWGVTTIHARTNSTVVAPIVDWTSDAVWNFIRGMGLPYCSLYDEGFKRLGCIGCPMNDKARVRDFARWPAHAKAWRRAADLAWANNTTRHPDLLEKWPTADSHWHWWMKESEDSECQGVLDLFL